MKQFPSQPKALVKTLRSRVAARQSSWILVADLKGHVCKGPCLCPEHNLLHLPELDRTGSLLRLSCSAWIIMRYLHELQIIAITMHLKL